ncbi:MAG: hypothetical protein IJT04_07210 [Bacteroidales bacterium]|nr:hypothetical protein [Bacteroidales bacterium]
MSHYPSPYSLPYIIHCSFPLTVLPTVPLRLALRGPDDGQVPELKSVHVLWG